MNEYSDFTRWIFPNQPTPFFPNAVDLPEEVEGILEEISADTQIPISWLQMTAGLLVDGLAGLQCLWYLHGAEGEIQVDLPPPDWTRRVMAYAAIVTRAEEKEAGRSYERVVADSLDWRKANFVLRKVKRTHQDYPPTTEQLQTVKLGKWMERYIANKGLDKHTALQMRHEIKNRMKDSYMTWRITAHPYDVLTMSFKRPWSSCMRPGSDYDYQYGLLSDLAAGAAVMFFYRPETEVPAGRLVLRPALDKGMNPAILSGGTVYGTGPHGITPGELTRMLIDAGVGQVPVHTANQCSVGSQGRMLSRMIYSDTGGGGCSQSDADYDRAYYRLGNADWPPPALDIGKLRAFAEGWQGELECEIGAAAVDSSSIDTEKIARGAYERLGLREDDPEDIMEALEHSGMECREEALAELESYLSLDSETSIYDVVDEDVISECEWNTVSLVQQALHEYLNKHPTMLLAYKPHWAELSDETTEFLTGLRTLNAYKYCEATKGYGGRVIPAAWTPDMPPASIIAELGLSLDPGVPQSKEEWRARSGLYLPPEGDPRQLELFRIERYEARVVVAICMDEDVDGYLIDDAQRDLEVDVGWPRYGERPVLPFIDEAAVWTTVPAGTYSWEDFVERER